MAASSTCSLPLTVRWTSGIRRQGEYVGEMDEPRGGARDRARSCLVLRLGQRPPEIACGEQQLADLRKIAGAPVRLLRRVQREAEGAERVLLPDDEQRERHRQVLVYASERHR